VLPCALRIHATHGKKGSRNAPYPYATSLYQPREVETTIVVGKALFYKYYILFHATSQNITDKKTCNAGARPPPFFAYPPPPLTPFGFRLLHGLSIFLAEFVIFGIEKVEILQYYFMSLPGLLLPDCERKNRNITTLFQGKHIYNYCDQKIGLKVETSSSRGSKQK
jgi:hypothetical protein